MSINSILVIDDDDIFRTGLCKILELEKFKVVEARDGVEGLSRFESERPDLVLTDILMPNKEGIETIIEILEKAPDQKILAMSGGGRGSPREYLEFAKDFGAQRILQKPFQIKVLLNMIREWKEDSPSPPTRT